MKKKNCTIYGVQSYRLDCFYSLDDAICFSNSLTLEKHIPNQIIVIPLHANYKEL